MDIAELRMYSKAYAKKVSGLQTAMDNGDVDAVQELLDESHAERGVIRFGRDVGSFVSDDFSET